MFLYVITKYVDKITVVWFEIASTDWIAAREDKMMNSSCRVCSHIFVILSLSRKSFFFFFFFFFYFESSSMRFLVYHIGIRVEGWGV